MPFRLGSHSNSSVNINAISSTPQDFEEKFRDLTPYWAELIVGRISMRLPTTHSRVVSEWNLGKEKKHCPSERARNGLESAELSR